MRLACLAALALVTLIPRTSLAEGPAILVLEPKGNASWGGPIIAKSLRKKLDTSLTQKDYAKALKELKLKDSTDPQVIAKVGKAAGAEYVLVLTITKKGWQYTANAVLINTTSGEQQMDFKSGYFKPKVEGADRGERIARVTMEKLAALGGGTGAVAAAPPARDTAPPPPPPPARDTPPPPPPPARDPPPPPPSDRVAANDPVRDRIDDAPPVASPPAAPSSSSSSPGLARNDPPADNPSRITEPMDGGRAQPDDILHISVGGGSGVLHTFDLTSGDGRPSRLSYQTDPLSLIVADLEALIPMIKSGVFGHMAFSPIRFNTRVGATTSEPSGTLFDLSFGLKFHLELSGTGRDAIELLPALGLRVGLLGVGDHPSNLIHGSTSVAPFLGAQLRLPFMESFEVLVGADFALVVGYSETPSQSRDGDFGSGIQFGAGLGLRYWLTDMLGIAFDSRFDLRSISLENSSQRQAAPGDDLVDVGISNRDLRFSLGVAIRI